MYGISSYGTDESIHGSQVNLNYDDFIADIRKYSAIKNKMRAVWFEESHNEIHKHVSVTVVVVYEADRRGASYVLAVLLLVYSGEKNITATFQLEYFGKLRLIIKAKLRAKED